MNLDLTPVTIFVMPVYLLCVLCVHRYWQSTSRMLWVELQVFHQKSLRGCDLNVAEEVYVVLNIVPSICILGALIFRDLREGH